MSTDINMKKIVHFKFFGSDELFSEWQEQNNIEIVTIKPVVLKVYREYFYNDRLEMEYAYRIFVTYFFIRD
jgi:hypothetical protein